MKRRTDTAAAGLDDALQADVMRFMAIIAFCLVAIMALARNAVPLDAAAADAVAVGATTPVLPAPAPSPAAPLDMPAPVTPARPRPPSAPMTAADRAPARSEEITTSATAVTDGLSEWTRDRSRSEPVVARPGEAARRGDQLAARQSAPRPPEAPDATSTPQVTAPTAARATASSSAPARDSVQVSTSERAPDEQLAEAPERTDRADAGLSLRFASDGDFLRLVNREAIEVFAFRPGEVLALAPGLRFTAARAPGQVHELLPATIPAPVGDALAAALAAARVDADAGSFSWGVRMPERIARRLRAHVDAGDAGVLVIDRFGEVRLRAAADQRENDG